MTQWASALLEQSGIAQVIRTHARLLRRLATLDEVLANSAFDRREPSSPWLLAPGDLQAVKASGVTFVESLLERVIEERAAGDASRAEEVRVRIMSVLGDRLASVRPGSKEAEAVSNSTAVRESGKGRQCRAVRGAEYRRWRSTLGRNAVCQKSR